MKVPFYRHGLSGHDSGLVGQVLETPFLTSGDVGREVERQLCEFFSVPHALLVNSWTNGAVATLLALDIGPGDEVIVPAMTFIASANVVELVGAHPVFVDVDPGTLLMTPESVVGVLTSKTRAVIPVHLYGQMVDIEVLRTALNDRPDVAIVEDAAHCFEGSLNGFLPGHSSDAAIFSFYATKNVTCGEGGAIVTRDSALHERLVQTRLHGMTAGAVDRFKGGSYRHWDMKRLGTKANLPDLLAALLPPQIASIRGRLSKREAICERYNQAFGDTCIRLVEKANGAVNARHLFPIHVPARSRGEFISAMSDMGVGTTVNYRSVATLTYYGEKYGYGPEDFPVSYEWGAGTLSLPLYPDLQEGEQRFVIDTTLELLDSIVGAHAPS